MSDQATQFAAMMLPYAIEVSRRTGLDPRLVIAQSALETGYGKSAPGNNYFGIKSHGKGGGGTYTTTEVYNGVPVQERASFRAYSGPAESAADYADFILRNGRYRKVMEASGLEAQIAAMAASGYATDPNYGRKLASIANGIPIGDAEMIGAEAMLALGKSPRLPPASGAAYQGQPFMPAQPGQSPPAPQQQNALAFTPPQTNALDPRNFMTAARMQNLLSFT
jgi:flagellar protein FlgJ